MWPFLFTETVFPLECVGFDMVNPNFAPVVGMVYASPSYTVSKFLHARKRTTRQWKSTIRLWTRKGIPEKYYFALTMLLCMSCVTDFKQNRITLCSVG